MSYFYTTTNSTVLATYNGQTIIANEIVNVNLNLYLIREQNELILNELQEINKTLKKIYK